MPLQPILWTMPATWTSLSTSAPLAAPASAKRRLGTANSETPLMPAGAPSMRASVRCTMFSVRSWSPPEMKILAPLMRKWPSRVGVARVATSARLEPACGSVSAMVPVHSPAYMRVMKRSRSDGDAERFDEVRGSGREPDVAGRRQVAGHEVGAAQRRDRDRQLLAADGRGPRGVGQAERHQLRIDLAQARMDQHPPVDQAGRLGVDGAVRRRQHVARETACAAEEEIEGLAPVVGEGRQRQEAILDRQHFVEQEVDVAIGEERVRHDRMLQ